MVKRKEQWIGGVLIVIAVSLAGDKHESVSVALDNRERVLARSHRVDMEIKTVCSVLQRTSRCSMYTVEPDTKNGILWPEA